MSMYPQDEVLQIYGKEVRFPGLKDGKFTNGDFNNPLVAPSFIPAETVNLILDNLNELITSLDGVTNNTGINQLSDLFTASAVANRGIKRSTNGTAKVAPPIEADDIARLDTVTNHASSSNTHEALIRNTAYPLGVIVAQYPTQPPPSDLFGGTWTKVLTGGYFFRTEGGQALAFGGGVQGDAIRNIWGRDGKEGSYDLNGAFMSREKTARTSQTGNDYPVYECFLDASIIVPTAPENRPINQTYVLWKKTGLAT